MKQALLALALISSSPTFAADRVERAASSPVRVQLDSMPLGSLVTVLMRDVLKVPYVIAPDVLTDARPVSVNLLMPRDDLPARVVGFLRGIGLQIRLNGGTVYVAKKSMESSALGGAAMAPGGFGDFAPHGVVMGHPLSAERVSSPVQVGITDTSEAPLSTGYRRDSRPDRGDSGVDQSGFVTIVVTPAHRPVVELANVLGTILPNLIVAARSGVSPQGTTIAPELVPDRLVASGSPQDIERASSILSAIDKPRPTVSIRAVIMEVRTTRARGSALSVLASALGGKVELGLGSSAIPGEQFLKIAVGGFRAVLSAVANDGRFHIIAEPSLAAVSGSTASINSGSQVPTLGAVSFSQDGGTPIRSVIYRDSGVSLSVRPVVRGGEIELAVTQERSSFVRTNTGVDDSPTLNKSSATALVAIQPGQTIALAGLDERADGNTRDGLLGGLLGSRSRTKETSQLLLLVQADTAPAPVVVAPLVERVASPAKPDA